MTWICPMCCEFLGFLNVSETYDRIAPGDGLSGSDWPFRSEEYAQRIRTGLAGPVTDDKL